MAAEGISGETLGTLQGATGQPGLQSCAAISRSVRVCVLPSLSLLAPCEGRIAITQQPGGIVLKVNCIKHVWCSALDWKHTVSC